MKRKVIAAPIAISLFPVFPMAVSSGEASSNPDADIYVNTTGWWRPGAAFNESSNPIQDAELNASDGDIIFVYNGTYLLHSTPESGLSVNTPNLTLRGEGADVVTLDGNGVIAIFVGAKGYGFKGPAPGCVVEGFTIKNCSTGVAVVENSPNCIIRDNIIRPFTRGISTFGQNTTIIGNIIDGGTGRDIGTVAIERRNCTFMQNVVTNATAAYGTVYIGRACSHSIIANNIIKNNTGAGILALGGNNTITRNEISSNGYGFCLLRTASGNEIYLNNIVDNGVTVTTYGSTPPAVTYWNSTKPINYTYNGRTYTNYLGNYWGSDYTNGDADGDGIGDTPYTVPEGLGEDYRPLMAGFENYFKPAAEQPDLIVTEINAYHNNTGCPAWFNLSNEVDVTVKNNGTASAGAFNISLYIEGDYGDTTMHYFGKLPVPGLGAGNSTTVTFTDWVPIGDDCLQPPCDFNWSYKDYNFTAIADCDNDVAESNETNNETTIQGFYRR